MQPGRRDGDHDRAELRRDDDAAAARVRHIGQLTALRRADRQHDEALAEDNGRRRVGARHLGLERVRDGHDVDPGARRERAADRLTGLDRQGEGDLADLERRTEAERPLARVRFEDADIDILTRQDPHGRVTADDGIEAARGVRRRVGRADADDLDHLGGDRREDGDVDLGPDDPVARLGEVDERAGTERGDEEDGGVDAPACSHPILLNG